MMKKENQIMRNRTFHTSINLLIEPGIYQRLKMIARLQHTTMSKIIREGILQKQRSRRERLNERVQNLKKHLKSLEKPDRP
jgi:macrodomain Ter protein organizer (MatP/YcbG family)